MEGLEILNTQQIQHRINRMAFQVYEEHFHEEELVLAGIPRKGYALAEMMKKKLEEVTGKPIHLFQVEMDKRNLIDHDVQIAGDLKALEGKPVILVDDVINSGKTLFYACKPFQEVLLKKLKILVLVNRDHIEFPVQPDYTGLSLATTLQERIVVEINEKDQHAYLK